MYAYQFSQQYKLKLSSGTSDKPWQLYDKDWHPHIS